MQLRPYQQAAVTSLFKYFERRVGDPLVVLPTGSGKSVVQADFINKACTLYEGTRILCATHVKELVDQNAKAVIRWAPDLSLKIGINSAGLGRRDTQSPILFAGIQSIHRKPHEIGHRDLILVDEAHLIPHKGHGMYRKLIEKLRDVNPHAKLIGFTATPYRTGTGLLTQGEGKLFSSVCYSANIVELIDAGYLSNLVTQKGSQSYDVSNVRVRGGEFMPSDLSELLKTSHDVTVASVEEIIAEGQDRRAWLVFCGSVEQAEQVNEMMRDRKISCEVITGETETARRDTIIQSYKAGALRCLVNVNVLTTGFDVPHVDLLGLLRPTKSPGLYVQMLGRGMRIAEGKSDCLVLDFGGNIDRHGPINAVEVPRPSKGDGEAITKSCPECLYEGIPAGSMHCPECGFEFPQREIKIHQRSRKDVIARTRRDWAEITRVDYSRHRKAGKPDSLKVTYWGGLNKICSEWVCIEHDGYAQQKALGWLTRRIGEDDFPPATVTAAIEMGKAGKFLEPRAILVDTTKRFAEVCSYNFEGLPPGAELSDKLPGDQLRIDFGEHEPEAPSEPTGWGER